MKKQRRSWAAGSKGGAMKVAASNGAFPLNEARSREIVRIADTVGCGKHRAKLATLGLTPGSTMTVCLNMGGPLVVEARGSRLSLGRGMASKILVERTGEADETACGSACACENQVCRDEG